MIPPSGVLIFSHCTHVETKSQRIHLLCLLDGYINTIPINKDIEIVIVMRIFG